MDKTIESPNLDFQPFQSPFRENPYCLGAPLARAEVLIVIEVLHQRLPRLRLVPDQPLEYRDGLVLHGLKHLWVEPGE